MAVLSEPVRGSDHHDRNIQLMQFRNNFKGDPRAQVQQLLNSGNDEITSQLEDLMRSVPDERTRKKIQNIMNRM